jgi:hypothetical protein
MVLTILSLPSYQQVLYIPADNNPAWNGINISNNTVSNKNTSNIIYIKLTMKYVSDLLTQIHGGCSPL